MNPLVLKSESEREKAKNVFLNQARTRTEQAERWRRRRLLSSARASFGIGVVPFLGAVHPTSVTYREVTRGEMGVRERERALLYLR